MLKIKRGKSKAYLSISDYKFIGFYSKNFRSYPESGIVLFNNSDIEDNNVRIQFYDLLKNIPVKDIPNDVQFNIIPVDLNESLPNPLDKTPFPFDNITFGKIKSDFFVRFSAFQDERDENNWDLKWASAFYFRKLKEINTDKTVKIFEIDESLFKEIYIQFNIPEEKKIEAGVEDSIFELKKLLQKVELELSGLSGLFKAIEIWHNNSSNKKESFWQNTLTEYSWVLSLIFNSPNILFEEQAFLGGKTLSNTDGKLIDFVLQNKLTENLALIEIKSPNTKILGKKYRNTYSISEETTGAISQLLDYREQLLKDFYSIYHNSDSKFTLLNPKLLLIIGSLNKMTTKEKEVFEMFRLDLKSVEILTFDEVFEKVFMQIELLNNNDLIEKVTQ